MPAAEGVRMERQAGVALAQLAAEVPAAVLAELLQLTPGTATRWTRDAGGDWSRYAAELARGTQSPDVTNSPPACHQREPIQHNKNTAGYQYSGGCAGPCGGQQARAQ